MFKSQSLHLCFYFLLAFNRYIFFSLKYFIVQFSLFWCNYFLITLWLTVLCIRLWCYIFILFLFTCFCKSTTDTSKWHWHLTLSIATLGRTIIMLVIIRICICICISIITVIVVVVVCWCYYLRRTTTIISIWLFRSFGVFVHCTIYLCFIIITNAIVVVVIIIKLKLLLELRLKRTKHLFTSQFRFSILLLFLVICIHDLRHWAKPTSLTSRSVIKRVFLLTKMMLTRRKRIAGNVSTSVALWVKVSLLIVIAKDTRKILHHYRWVKFCLWRCRIIIHCTTSITTGKICHRINVHRGKWWC